MGPDAAQRNYSEKGLGWGPTPPSTVSTFAMLVAGALRRVGGKAPHAEGLTWRSKKRAAGRNLPVSRPAKNPRLSRRATLRGPCTTMGDRRK